MKDIDIKELEIPAQAAIEKMNDATLDFYGTDELPSNIARKIIGEDVEPRELIVDIYYDWEECQIDRTLRQIANDVADNEEEAERLLDILYENWEGWSNDWINDLMERTTALLTINLKIHHEFAWYLIGGALNDCEYHEIDDALSLFGISPHLVSNYHDLIEDWPTFPERKPIVDPDKLFECWNNSPYGGQYVVLWETDLATAVAVQRHIDDGGSVKIGKGASIITQDYLNGSSGLDFQLTADLELRADQIAGIYHDESDRYGVQSVCQMARAAWQSSVSLVGIDPNALRLTAQRSTGEYLFSLLIGENGARIEFWSNTTDYEIGAYAACPSLYELHEGKILRGYQDYITADLAYEDWEKRVRTTTITMSLELLKEAEGK